MNYEEYIKEMIDGYAQARQRMWDSWAEIMQDYQSRVPDNTCWGRLGEVPTQVWEYQLERLMDAQMIAVFNAQRVWIQQGLSHLDPWKYPPTLMDDWMQQIQQLAKNGAKLNKAVINSFAELSRRLGATEAMDLWQQSLKWAVEGWEEAFRRAIEVQLASLPKEGPEGAKQPPSRAGKSSRERSSKKKAA